MSKWQPGQSGNKSGRPPKGGAHAERIREIIESVFGNRDGVLTTVAAMAQGGDLQACALLLSRCIPPLKPTHEPQSAIDAEELAAMTPAQRAEAINTAAQTGRLPADVAALLLDGIERQYRILEQTELTERLSELEKRIQQSKTN